MQATLHTQTVLVTFHVYHPICRKTMQITRSAWFDQDSSAHHRLRCSELYDTHD